MRNGDRTANLKAELVIAQLRDLRSDWREEALGIEEVVLCIFVGCAMDLVSAALRVHIYVDAHVGAILRRIVARLNLYCLQRIRVGVHRRE